MRSPKLTPLRVALLDDHTLIREALKIRLAVERDFIVVDTYATSSELTEGLGRESIDLLILDYQLADGELDGIRLISALRTQYPNLRIVIFSSNESSATANMCIRAGAHGFVGKSRETDELLIVIRRVATDRIYLSTANTAGPQEIPMSHQIESGTSLDGDEALLNYSKLSPKEREVLRVCLEGLTVAQAAIKFSRSRKTISGQKQAAFRKLGIRTDTELFKIQEHLKKN